jgi:hypothetical protein
VREVAVILGDETRRDETRRDETGRVGTGRDEMDSAVGRATCAHMCVQWRRFRQCRLAVELISVVMSVVDGPVSWNVHCDDDRCPSRHHRMIVVIVLLFINSHRHHRHRHRHRHRHCRGHHHHRRRRRVRVGFAMASTVVVPTTTTATATAASASAAAAASADGSSAARVRDRAPYEGNFDEFARRAVELVQASGSKVCATRSTCGRCDDDLMSSRLAGAFSHQVSARGRHTRRQSHRRCQGALSCVYDGVVCVMVCDGVMVCVSMC